MGAGVATSSSRELVGRERPLGARLPPGLVIVRADDTETTGESEGEVTPQPELYSGVWWEGTAMRSRSWDREGYRLRILRKGEGRGRGFYCFLLTVLRKARRGWARTEHPLPPSVPLGRWVLVRRMDSGLERKVREGSKGHLLGPTQVPEMPPSAAPSEGPG